MELSEAERVFVNEASRKLAEFAFELLEDGQRKCSYELRPIVVAVAIGSIAGAPTDKFGSDVFGELNAKWLNELKENREASK